MAAVTSCENTLLVDGGTMKIAHPVNFGKLRNFRSFLKQQKPTNFGILIETSGAKFLTNFRSLKK